MSYHLVGLALLAVASAHAGRLNRMSAFAAAMEFHAFLMMPVVAVMRATAIVLAQPGLRSTREGPYGLLRRPGLAVVIAACALSVVLLATAAPLGARLYRLDPGAMPWWTAFVTVAALTLPVYFINAMQRGLSQSRNDFLRVFMVESVAQWCILLPLVYVGMTIGSPWVAWSGSAVVEFVIAGALLVGACRLAPEVAGRPRRVANEAAQVGR